MSSFVCVKSYSDCREPFIIFLFVQLSPPSSFQFPLIKCRLVRLLFTFWNRKFETAFSSHPISTKKNSLLALKLWSGARKQNQIKTQLQNFEYLCKKDKLYKTATHRIGSPIQLEISYKIYQELLTEIVTSDSAYKIFKWNRVETEIQIEFV